MAFSDTINDLRNFDSEDMRRLGTAPLLSLIHI